jgi:hypothetical protein
MFSESYVGKCVKYRKEIEALVRQFRCPFKEEEPTKPECLFRQGDAFHHPPSMKPGELKFVKDVVGETDIVAVDPLISYRASECVLLPSEELLRASLCADSSHPLSKDFRKGAERLLDVIVEARGWTG